MDLLRGLGKVFLDLNLLLYECFLSCRLVCNFLFNIGLDLVSADEINVSTFELELVFGQKFDLLVLIAESLLKGYPLLELLGVCIGDLFA